MNIPASSSPLHEIFDFDSAESLFQNLSSLPTIPEAYSNAQSFFANEPAARKIYYVVRDSFANIMLLFSFDRDGSAELVWQF